MKLRLAFSLLTCITFLYSCQYFIGEDKGHPEYFDKIINYGDTILARGYSKLPGYLDSAYNKFPNASEYDISRKYKLLAKDYDNPANGHIYIDSAISILEEQIKYHPTDLFYAYQIKADLYTVKNDFDNAFKYLYNAKVLAKKINLNNNYNGLINYSLGNLLFKQKKYKDALAYFKLAYNFYSKSKLETFNSLVEIQSNLNTIGLCYERLNELDSAIIAYNNALNFLHKSETKFHKELPFIALAKGIVYGNLASTYVKTKNYKKAEETFLISLALDTAYNEDILFNQIKIANLYLITGRPEKTKNLINVIQKQIDSSNEPLNEVKLRFGELSWKYYESIGNLPLTYNAFKSYHSLKDSTDLVDLRKAKDINSEFIKYAQKSEIESLKKKDELKTLYLILAVGLSLLSALVIFLIYRNSRLIKNNIKKLTILNAKISGHNEMMEKTLEALEQSQEENTHMMQVVAHDMRTPIAGVIGLTSLMLEEDDLNEEQREILSMINTSGADTLNFINDLLQVQHNKAKLIKEPVEMHTLLKYCITLLDSKAKEKQQQLKITTIPIEISISREKIWRVMSNLITNAIKFSPHGTTIAVTMEEKPLSILISVKDNGIGIPLDLADKLFNMDAEVQREGTDGEKSFGLGLAISKQIIEAHNGNIWFESLPGFGTTFFVELPITES